MSNSRKVGQYHSTGAYPADRWLIHSFAVAKRARQLSVPLSDKEREPE